jgi:hypothetical protein
MPASVLGDAFNIHIGKRSYLSAPADRVFVLRAAYQAAADATGHAARAMDKLAESGTASHHLALLRTAAPLGITGPSLRVQPDVLAASLRTFDRPVASCRPDVDVDDQTIVKAYVEDGLTMIQCSYLFVTPYSRVSEILKANGVTPGKDRGRETNAVSDREAAPRLPRRRAVREPGPGGERRAIQPPGNRVSRADPGRAPSL